MERNDQADTAWLSTQRHYHPQLTEKAAIDLVNGLEVVDDHLRCRNTRSFVRRILYAITGRASREQYLIDINLKTGQEAVAAWVQDLQAFQAKSDLALTVVTKKLTETRTALNRYALHQSELEAAISQIEQRLDGLAQQVEALESGNKANIQVDLLLHRWEERMRMSRIRSPLVQIFLTIDELWWGDFGCYCRLARDPEDIDKFIEISRRKLAEHFAENLGLKAHDFIAVETLLSSIEKMPDEQRELVCYLADHGTADRNPLFQAISLSAQGETDIVTKLPKLPRAFSPLSLSHRLIRESRRATAEIGL